MLSLQLSSARACSCPLHSTLFTRSSSRAKVADVASGEEEPSNKACEIVDAAATFKSDV